MSFVRRHWRLATLVVAGLLFVAILQLNGIIYIPFEKLLSEEGAAELVAGAGIMGPVIVIALMTIAVVFSPIPSAPIALAAGAAYGHIWGTLYVLTGAEAGAMIAFALARNLGREMLVRWFGDKIDIGLLGSQNTLTLAVFASRLMPFVSFDMISYAAGLSCLRFPRFALATLAGIIPASFILAHIGVAAASSGLGTSWMVVLGLGLLTGLPLIYMVIRPKRPQKTGKRQ